MTGKSSEESWRGRKEATAWKPLSCFLCGLEETTQPVAWSSRPLWRGGRIKSSPSACTCEGPSPLLAHWLISLPGGGAGGQGEEPEERAQLASKAAGPQ